MTKRILRGHYQTITADVVHVSVDTSVATGQPPRQDEKSNLGHYNHNNNTISANRSRNGSFDYDKYDDDFEDYQEEEEREFYEGGEHELSPEYIAHFGVPEDYKRGVQVSTTMITLYILLLPSMPTQVPILRTTSVLIQAQAHGQG